MEPAKFQEPSLCGGQWPKKTNRTPQISGFLFWFRTNSPRLLFCSVKGKPTSDGSLSVSPLPVFRGPHWACFFQTLILHLTHLPEKKCRIPPPPQIHQHHSKAWFPCFFVPDPVSLLKRLVSVVCFSIFSQTPLPFHPPLPFPPLPRPPGLHVFPVPSRLRSSVRPPICCWPTARLRRRSWGGGCTWRPTPR